MQITSEINNSKIKLIEGDITDLSVDAIVNAANKNLKLGAGVAGAIRTKGGSEIQIECDKIGGTFVGGAVITTAGKLKAKWVIHAVGPMMGEGNEDYKLSSAIKNSLKLAEEHNLQSIAFPAISTGIYGYPIDKCAKIMLENVNEYLNGNTNIKEVVVCLWGNESYEVFKNRLSEIIK